MFVLACLLTLAQNPQDDLLTRIEAKAGKDMPFTLAVTLKIKAGQEARFEAAAQKAAAASTKEKGCHAYEFHKSTDAAGEYLLLEKWANVTALRAHFGAAHFKELIAVLGEVGDGPPAMKVLLPLK
jgi:quinol monooxygenase YgiN